ncbi:protein unc-93 homolog B1 [Heliangelus exortis]|uniref:protein unc-93 homolog B1 n=1 Tax=Heliangelus exortis TaxID=472823 RepID=UPI003A90D6F4
MEKVPGCQEEEAQRAAEPEAQLDDFVGANPEYNEEEEEQKYFRRKRLGVVKNVVASSLAVTFIYGVCMGLLEMQLILHYDETYREVKYSTIQLGDIDHKVLLGIILTPTTALLYAPLLIRFFGTKWALFLSVGLFALFVSSNYWERYYTLVPSAVALGVATVPLWAAVGNYITRMAQKYHEYLHYQEEERRPRGGWDSYLIIFNSVFYCCFHLSFACAQLPMFFFLNNYLYNLNHTLHGVKHCGTLSHGTLPGFNKTVLQSLPRSANLLLVESILMGTAFLAMLLVLVLCGSAYSPTEELDLRSWGWGNIFQMPFKHLRDFRLRLLLPLCSYTGLEGLFVCTGFTLNYGVCALGLEKLGYLLLAYGLSASACSCLALSSLRFQREVPVLAGAALHAVLLLTLFFWAPQPRDLLQAPLLYSIATLWGAGSALNRTSSSILLGRFYRRKERQDLIFTISHWCQTLATFTLYLCSGLPMKAKLSIMLLTLGAGVGSYLWLEQKLARHLGYRLPRIPRPPHPPRGYCCLEEENSDETGDSSKEDSDTEHPPAAAGDHQDGHWDGHDQPLPDGHLEPPCEDHRGDHQG